MLHGHDFARIRHGRHAETVRHGGGIRGERVVSGDRCFLRTARKERAVPGKPDERLLAVHQLFRVCDDPAICGADGLVSQTDAQNGNLSAQFFYDVHDDAGVFRSAGSRGENDPLGAECANVVDGHGVVPDHLDIRVNLSGELEEII